eukprot:scaffold98117_cov59-Phaeocystis_antarctica.AAC.1
MLRGNAARWSRSATPSAATGSRRSGDGGRGATRASRAARTAPPARSCGPGERMGTVGGGPHVARWTWQRRLRAWRARRVGRRRRSPRALCPRTQASLAGSRGTYAPPARRLAALAPLSPSFLQADVVAATCRPRYLRPRPRCPRPARGSTSAGQRAESRVPNRRRVARTNASYYESCRHCYVKSLARVEFCNSPFPARCRARVQGTQ